MALDLPTFECGSRIRWCGGTGGRRRHDDATILIDRHVRHVQISSPFGAGSLGVAAAFQLEGWERGSQVLTVTPLLDHVPPHDEGEDAWKTRGRLLEQAFQEARTKAVSALRINVGLAVRNGFEAVLHQRSKDKADREQ